MSRRQRTHPCALGDEGLEIVYSSRRRICAMLRGVVEGTGRRRPVDKVEQLECMHCGAQACRFAIRFP